MLFRKIVFVGTVFALFWAQFAISQHNAVHPVHSDTHQMHAGIEHHGDEDHDHDHDHQGDLSRDCPECLSIKIFQQAFFAGSFDFSPIQISNAVSFLDSEIIIAGTSYRPFNPRAPPLS